MSAYKTSGSTKLTGVGIRKHFSKMEPWQSVFELVWNGFDAEAQTVHVSCEWNDAHGLEQVSVLDDGVGINFRRDEENFGKFNDSSKVGRASQHGAHGRGRLAFHKLCNEARWYTRSVDGDAVISVQSSNLEKYEVNGIEERNQHALIADSKSGTCVELFNMTGNLPKIERLSELFSAEFGWYLTLNPEKVLKINGADVIVPMNELIEREIVVGDHNFVIKIIRWIEKPSSEKSYVYLMSSGGATIHKELSSLNKKPNFYTSVYVISEWADAFVCADDEMLLSEFDATSRTWKGLQRDLGSITQRVYEEFLKEYVDEQINGFEESGFFPEYKYVDVDEAQWRRVNVKTTVKSIYLADPSLFNNLKKKQAKVLIRLIDKLLLSNENDALMDVLEGALDLSQESIVKLAGQMKSITLENIVSTIEVLSKRQEAVHQLRAIMNDHYLSVLETPDLQKVIENNTWLFGPSYEVLGAEEDTFTKVCKGLRDSMKGIDSIGPDDLEAEESEYIEISNRQPDLFLARKMPALDSNGKLYYRCVIIEIKRPSVALNINHLRQLDDYAGLIKKFPEHTSTSMHFELILVGRKISSADIEIESRLRNHSAKGDMGLVSDDPGMKRYVKNWYTILDDFELKNIYLLDRLKLKRDSLENAEKEVILASLQKVDSNDGSEVVGP